MLQAQIPAHKRERSGVADSHFFFGPFLARRVLQASFARYFPPPLRAIRPPDGFTISASVVTISWPVSLSSFVTAEGVNLIAIEQDCPAASRFPGTQLDNGASHA
jgi:hypothetical protein